MLTNKVESWVLTEGIQNITTYKYAVQILNINGDVLGETKDGTGTYSQNISPTFIDDTLVFENTDPNNAIVKIPTGVTNNKASFMRICKLNGNLIEKTMFTKILNTSFMVSDGNHFNVGIVIFDPLEWVVNRVVVTDSNVSPTANIAQNKIAGLSTDLGNKLNKVEAVVNNNVVPVYDYYGSLSPNADLSKISDYNPNTYHSYTGIGRNLFDVLGVNNIPDAISTLFGFCNGSEEPYFSNLRIGDYIDGIDLSSIAASDCNSAGSSMESNNRIVIAAFNPYSNPYLSNNGSSISNNHILFSFRNIPLMARMFPDNGSNNGGYAASELRVFLDGGNGMGSGDYDYTAFGGSSNPVVAGAFLSALQNQFGGNFIRNVRRLLDSPGLPYDEWAWNTYSVWIPSAWEVTGSSILARYEFSDGQKIHYPLFANNSIYRSKTFNDSPNNYWFNDPVRREGNMTLDFNCYAVNYSTLYPGNERLGVSPVFCIGG